MILFLPHGRVGNRGDGFYTFSRPWSPQMMTPRFDRGESISAIDQVIEEDLESTTSKERVKTLLLRLIDLSKISQLTCSIRPVELGFYMLYLAWSGSLGPTVYNTQINMSTHKR